VDGYIHKSGQFIPEDEVSWSP